MTASPDLGGAPGAYELIVLLRDVIRTFPLPAAGEISIGRGESCTLRLDDASVSREHAVLRVGNGFVIEDLGSRNGTFVHKPVRADRRRADLATETMSVRQLIRRSAEVSVGDSLMFGAARAVVRHQSRREVPALTDLGAPTLGTRDEATRAVYAQAVRVARATINVILLGETGAGKEVLARAIHAQSPRAQGPFLVVNCAALSETLLESELFGYERGAFTGAVQARAGLFEAGSGGTVLLDEIGELPLGIQAKLLRVIEERAVRRLGANVPKPIDVRYIAATHRDLEGQVMNGDFRQDLYFRLNGISLTLPPLRERPGDLGELIEAFVAGACRELDLPLLAVAPEALELLRAYPWPGNVRELRNVIDRAVVLCTERVILPEHLPGAVRGEAVRLSSVPAPSSRGRQSTKPPPAPAGTATSEVEREPHSVERDRIVEALQVCGGNQTRAARMLGISRRTLVTRLSEYKIPRPHGTDDLAIDAE